MLAKGKRLNLKNDFKWVAAGRRIQTKFTTLFIKLGDNLFPRIGIAVSSKVFKNATKRNRARRLVSSALEILYESLPKSINIVALPKSGVVKVKSAEVLSDLKGALKRENVL